MELEKLREVIAEVLSVDTKEITLETTFLEDLGADSLDVFTSRYRPRKRSVSPRWARRWI